MWFNGLYLLLRLKYKWCITIENQAPLICKYYKYTIYSLARNWKTPKFNKCSIVEVNFKILHVTCYIRHDNKIISSSPVGSLTEQRSQLLCFAFCNCVCDLTMLSAGWTTEPKAEYSPHSSKAGPFLLMWATSQWGFWL